MNGTDEERLKKYSSQRCPTCDSVLTMEIIKKQIIGTCKKNTCKKIWLINEDNNNGKINIIEALEVSGLIEFYIELPFNLGYM